jgi:hypothetical protein
MMKIPKELIEKVNEAQNDLYNFYINEILTYVDMIKKRGMNRFSVKQTGSEFKIEYMVNIADVDHITVSKFCSDGKPNEEELSPIPLMEVEEKFICRISHDMRSWIVRELKSRIEQFTNVADAYRKLPE